MSFMPHIFLVSSEQKGDPRPLLNSLRAGDGVLLRHYRDRHRSLLAGELAHLCHKKRLAFFIAGDWHLAYQHGAGLHLPEWQIARLGSLRQMAKKLNAPITIAAHGRTSLLLGMKLGASAALLSPLFPTTSHSKARLLSPPMAASLCQTARGFPLFALGGVRVDNFHKIAGLGFQGFAATDPYKTGLPSSSR